MDESQELGVRQLIFLQCRVKDASSHEDKFSPHKLEWLRDSESEIEILPGKAVNRFEGKRL
jgi:hypothetical protein